MKILLLYATNSGSTFLISQQIAQIYSEANHQVELVDIRFATPKNFQDHDLIIMGSPSWDNQELEGQPHQAFFDFFQQHQTLRFDDQRVCVFGLGDKSYIYFCGAVDVLKKWVEDRGGQIFHEPLRINRFYFHDPEVSFKQAEEWAQSVLSLATSTSQLE